MSYPSSENTQDPNTLAPGQVFEGRFQILSVIGQGGVGVVYKAKQMHMDKVVAIKTLMLSVVADDEESFRRFEQESRAASSLSHPNIISIHDFGKSANGLAYLVMEYLGSKNLDDVLETDKILGPDRFLKVAVQICDALQHAHRKGVIHRDIKPSNIMLVDTEDATDTVKIVDFGLAKLTAVEGEQHLTKTGTLVGTPLYMSPEQCRGLELDHRTDIYSLGCVLYAALTGQAPLRGATALDTLYKHATEAPTPFAVACPDLNIPPRLEQVILKSLQKSPDQRQQSMMELRNDITDAIYYRSFHGGVTPQHIGPVEFASMPNSPRLGGGNQDQTLDISGNPLKQTLTALPADAAKAAGGAAPSQKAASTLRGVGASDTGDKVVISKSALMAVGAAAVGLVAASGLALFLNGKAITDSQHSRPDTASPTTAATQSPTPAPVTSAGPNSTPPAIPVSAKTLPSTAVSQAELPSASTSKPAKSSQPPAPAAPHKNALATGPQTTSATAIPRAPEIRAQAKSIKPKLIASAVPPVPKTEDHASRGGLFKGLRLLHQIHELEVDGKSQLVGEHWADAEVSFQKCLQLQRTAVGSNDPKLFINIAHLVSAQLHQRKLVEVRGNLLLAQEIFSSHPEAVLKSVSRDNDAVTVWRPLARASLDAGRAAHNQTDLNWAVSFYKLAVKAWSGSTTDDKYRKLLQDYCTALKESGNWKQAAALRKENGLPQEASPDIKPKKSQNKTIKKGRMIIWSR